MKYKLSFTLLISCLFLQSLHGQDTPKTHAYRLLFGINAGYGCLNPSDSYTPKNHCISYAVSWRTTKWIFGTGLEFDNITAVKNRQDDYQKYYWNEFQRSLFIGHKLSPSSWKVTIDLLGGASYHRVLNYEVRTYNYSDENYPISTLHLGSDAQETLGFSTFVAFPVSIPISEHWTVGIKPYGSIRISDDIVFIRGAFCQSYGCDLSIYYQLR